MIQVKKSPPPNSVLAFFDRPKEKQVGTPLWVLPGVKKVLRNDFKSKCAVCEQLIVEVDDAQPVALDLHTCTNSSGSWDQLLYTCNRCSDSWIKSLRKLNEIPEVLSPCNLKTDISDHLTTNFSCKLEGKTSLGEQTIDVFDLNREELVNARRKRSIELILKHRNDLQNSSSNIKKMPTIDDSMEFSFFLCIVSTQYTDFSLMCDLILDTERQKIAEDIIHNGFQSGKDKAKIAISIAKKLNRYLMLDPNWYGLGIRGNRAIEDLINRLER